jgi:hypothetical protein
LDGGRTLFIKDEGELTNNGVLLLYDLLSVPRMVPNVCNFNAPLGKNVEAISFTPILTNSLVSLEGLWLQLLDGISEIVVAVAGLILGRILRERSSIR